MNAAPSGGTVYLCASGSPYAQQVVVTGQVRLTGDPGATLSAPSTFPDSNLPPQFSSQNLFDPQAIVIAWGANASLSIQGITVAGPFSGAFTCAKQLFGVLVIDGATLNMDHSTVNNIRDADSSLWGCQYGVGVQIGRVYWPTANFGNFLVENFVGHGTITNSTIENSQKTNIVINTPGSTATISRDSVVGVGPVNYIAENGIEIGGGAQATVQANTISGYSYTGAGWASSGGIISYGGDCYGLPITTGTQIKQNKIVGSDVGVWVSDLTGDCYTPPATPTNETISTNNISDTSITNTTGWYPYPPIAYQAGIADTGNADSISQNLVCGYGYTPGYLALGDHSLHGPHRHEQPASGRQLSVRELRVALLETVQHTR